MNRPYLAVIAIPAPHEAIDTDIRYCEWRLVGEYPDRTMAMQHAYDAAVLHDADSYTVISPSSESYDTIRARLDGRPSAGMEVVA